MSQTTYYTIVPSPVDDLLLASDGSALTGLSMQPFGPIDAAWTRDAGPFREAVRQLRAYFEGELRAFDLPLALAGTEFQRSAWSALVGIGYGERISYAEQARRMGRPGASRAVGHANARNPIGIIVPCHRVIGSSGTLTGYGGGLERKRWLLEHEACVAARGTEPVQAPLGFLAAP